MPMPPPPGPVPDRSSSGHGLTEDEVFLETSVRFGNLAAVRARIGVLLEAFGEDFVQDVQLVCHELASNACDHADEPHHLRLRRRGRDGSDDLLVEVQDASADATPKLGTSTAGPNRGNGMKMVEALSDDWGVRRTDDAKVVWARLRLPSQDRSNRGLPNRS
ncbi:hypothetical protein CKY47_31015 [Saccharothrix yanglingensis]|uniref:Histidine kinase/HSP90-like ATPase domain-containing protein n=2 Tax=Saccharothrix yanglingensis TaxID=659496 RepID=A0ABU0XCA3_9PSEU|nr:hypothetical protein [Saccharothrix yanglingensis]